MRGANDQPSRIVQGDCRQVLAALPAQCVDLVVTDPPYLVGYHDRSGRQVIGDQDHELIGEAFTQVGRVLKPGAFVVSFYGWNHVDTFARAWRGAGLRMVGHLVWVKTYASSRGSTQRYHESAYLLAKGAPRQPRRALPDVLPWHYSGNRLHPTQKPVSAMRELIDAYSWPGELVLDPFAGSGTTAVAAAELGRRYLAIERDDDAVQVTRYRLGRSRR